MNQDQNNIRTMFETTIEFLNAHEALWNDRPPFVAAVTEVNAGLVAIGKAVEKQETPITGVAGDKASLRADLEEQTLEIADQLAALAAATEDRELGDKVAVTKSSLDLMTDNTLDETAKRVGDLATERLAVLKDYKVTAEEITALGTAREAFVGMKTTPRAKKAERTAQTTSLAERIADVRSIFRNKIDKMMTKFRKSEPDFYNGYFAARVIVNLAATHASPAKPPTAPGA